MKSRFLRTLFRGVAVVLCLAGIICTMCAFPVGRQLCLFGNWSCVLGMVVWLLLLWKPQGFARLQGMAAMCGMLTMIMFHFVLPLYSAASRSASQRTAEMLTRTVIPLLMMGDYLFFRPRARQGRHTPLLWTIPPIAYFLFTFALPALQTVFPRLPKHPYFLLSPAAGWILPSQQGYQGVWLNGIAILIVYVMAGYMLLAAHERRKSALTLFRLLAAMLCLYGQLNSFALLDKRPAVNWDALCYFTNLSNILCLVTWVLLLRKPEGFIRLHGMAAQAILLTMVVYHSLLSGFDFRLNTVSQFNNHVVHTFVPLMMVADFLFLRKREPISEYSPFIWVMAPVVYLGFVMLMPVLEKNVFPGMTKYPYFFVNPGSGWLLPSPQGTAGIVLNCMVIAVAYITAGFGMYGAYTWVCKKK